MLWQKKKNKEKNIHWNFTKPRIAVWCLVLLVCILLSALVMTSPGKIKREYGKFDCQEPGFAVYTLNPGSTMEQKFMAMGQSTGEASHLYLTMLRQASAQGSLQVRLYREKNGELLADVAVDFDQLPEVADVESYAESLMALDKKSRPDDSTMLGDGGWYLLKSGEHYRLEIVNQPQSGSVYLLGNDWIQSGKLLVDGEQQEGFLNLSWMRKSLYAPSRLLALLVLLTNATVLLGLALVLFTDVKIHMLYLLLAIGFGVVMLFDLTPLYGFDMHFQFDSAYVLSNQLLGIEGQVWTEYEDDPGWGTISYYRRYGDDYSQYQFFKANEVSANYTDTKAGLRHLFATEEEQELILVETDMGFVSEQLYMYFPQALGFAIARLLGLSMIPMLQLARILTYGVFVGVMFFAIRKAPFGKEILLTAALIPTVMVQMISLTRDAMIICMGFYITVQALKMTCSAQKPGKWDWLRLMAVSVLLAPCKMIYLPVSCLFLMVVYRHYILPAGKKGKKLLVSLILAAVAAGAAFVLLNWNTILSILYSASVSTEGEEAYSILGLLADPGQLLYLLGNTLRTEWGAYLVNAVQLFDIDLGSSDGVTLAVFALLAAGCCIPSGAPDLRKEERGYMLLVAVGVFLLTALASLRWTAADSLVIEGLQGRYLTPVLPLVCMACSTGRVLQHPDKAALLVKAGCCLFPAVMLMNMYLWTITC